MGNLTLHKIELLNISNLDDFCIIDTRRANSFNVAHFKDSINMQTKDEILEFLQNNKIAKPVLFVCFSGVNAKNMVEKLLKYKDNIFTDLYYLNAGIMEAYNFGLPLVEL